MVQSKATTVDDYIAEASPDRAEALRRVREVARRELAGYEERMMYGMPAYVRDGHDGGFAFANQKQDLALYVETGVHAKNAEALAGLDCGKCCIRFRKLADIDLDLVTKLLRDTVESDEAPC